MSSPYRLIFMKGDTKILGLSSVPEVVVQTLIRVLTSIEDPNALIIPPENIPANYIGSIFSSILIRNLMLEAIKNNDVATEDAITIREALEEFERREKA